MNAKEYLIKYCDKNLVDVLDMYAKYKTNELKRKLERVYTAGVNGICDVGMANYQGRIDKAEKELEVAMYGK